LSVLDDVLWDFAGDGLSNKSARKAQEAQEGSYLFDGSPIVGALTHDCKPVFNLGKIRDRAGKSYLSG
jgi:hypothetical protein